MKKTELVQLLTQIKLGYPNFLWNEQTEAFWYRYLQDFNFYKAQQNLDAHIISSTYEPRIADIIKHDPEQFVDHEQQKLDTKERLAKLSIVQPAVSDERIEEIRREVAAGMHDHKFKDDPYLGRRVIGD